MAVPKKPDAPKTRWRTIKAFPAGGAALGSGAGVVGAAASTLIPFPGVAALLGLILLGVGLLLPKKHQDAKAGLISAGAPLLAVDAARGFAMARAKWFPGQARLPAPAPAPAPAPGEEPTADGLHGWGTPRWEPNFDEAGAPDLNTAWH